MTIVHHSCKVPGHGGAALSRACGVHTSALLLELAPFGLGCDFIAEGKKTVTHLWPDQNRKRWEHFGRPTYPLAAVFVLLFWRWLAVETREKEKLNCAGFLPNLIPNPPVNLWHNKCITKSPGCHCSIVGVVRNSFRKSLI